MLKYRSIQLFVLLGVIGVSRHVTGTYFGEKPAVSEERIITLRDLKEYIQPILYQKYLLTPKDSLVIKQAKVVVSEYLADSLIDSVKNESHADIEIRVSLKQGSNILTSAGASLVQAVTGGVSGSRNRTRPSQQHVFNQVDSIIQNVNGGNITGIVDQALLIRTSSPVRRLVNGILNSVFCNPVNRLWNRCAGGGSLIFGDML